MSVNLPNIIDYQSDGEDMTKQDLLDGVTYKESQDRLDKIDIILTQHMGSNYRLYIFLIYLLIILIIILIIYGL